MKDINDHNLKSVRKNQQNAKKIIQIGKDFLKAFNVKSFVYSKLFNDGTRLYVGNRSDWLECYLEKEFHEHTEHIKYYIPGDNIKSTVWSGFEKDEVMEESHLKGLWHGFSIHRSHDNCHEYFDFATDKENSLFPSMCLNNIETLESFCDYFKEEGHEIIDHVSNNNLIISKNWIPFEDVPNVLEQENASAGGFLKKINSKG